MLYWKTTPERFITVLLLGSTNRNASPQQNTQPKRESTNNHTNRDTMQDGGKTAPGMQDVVIRIQQRAGRKSITTIQGLYQELDFERLAKEFRKRWGCSAIVVETEKGSVVQLQGDQRTHLKEFLLAEELVWPDQLKVLGS